MNEFVAIQKPRSNKCVYLKFTNAYSVSASASNSSGATQTVSIIFLGGQRWRRSPSPLFCDSGVYGLFVTNEEWSERKYYPLFSIPHAPDLVPYRVA